MSEKFTAGKYGQYGLKDSEQEKAVPPTNAEGGEIPGAGPVDAVDATAHRLGHIEEKPMKKASSRLGQAVINEVDDKKR